jgi:hypothetical protein
MEKRIEAVVLDAQGYEIDRAEYDTLKDAKQRIKRVLSDEWAKSCEANHSDLGTFKGEVRVNGECVWDKFYKPNN